MRFESVPAKITLLPQGSKLGRLGTADGTNMENVWWVRKHKRLLYGFCEHPSGLHSCCKDPNWNPKWQPKEWKWKCPMVKKAQTTFLQVSRALVRITHLQQGPKLGPQGKTTGMKMETVWWIKKHKRLPCEFCAHLSGSHFCSKDPSWDPKGQSKEWKWEMSDGQKNINDIYANFTRTCQDHTFVARIQVGASRDSQRNGNGKYLMAKKHKRFLC